MLVVLDGDDTLWETERLYDEVRAECREYLTLWGYNGEFWETFAQETDIKRAATLGFSADRFPGSCRIAAEEMGIPSPICERIHVMARRPFEEPAHLYPDVWDGMKRLRDRADCIVLLTKGDRTVQWKRVNDSGLAPFLDAVVIVHRKYSSDFMNIKALYDGAAESSWNIGNNLTSDAIPASKAGFNSIWVDRYVWDYERDAMNAVEAPDDIHKLDSFTAAVDRILG